MAWKSGGLSSPNCAISLLIVCCAALVCHGQVSSREDRLWSSKDQPHTIIPNPLVPVELQAASPSLDQLHIYGSNGQVPGFAAVPALLKLIPTRTMVVNFEHLNIVNGETVVLPLVTAAWKEHSTPDITVSIQYYPIPTEPLLQGTPTWATSDIDCTAVDSSCTGPEYYEWDLLGSVVSPSGRDLVLIGLRDRNTGRAAVYVWRDGKLHRTVIPEQENPDDIPHARALVSLRTASDNPAGDDFSVIGIYSTKVNTTNMWRLDFRNNSRTASWYIISPVDERRPSLHQSIDMFFDESSQQIILFGGGADSEASCELWTYDLVISVWDSDEFPRDCSYSGVDKTYSTFVQQQSLLVVFINEAQMSAAAGRQYTVYMKDMSDRASNWTVLQSTVSGASLVANKASILAGSDAIYLVSSNEPYLFVIRRNVNLPLWSDSAVDFAPVPTYSRLATSLSQSIASAAQPEIQFQGPFGTGFAGPSVNVLLGGAVWDSRYIPYALSVVRRINSQLPIDRFGDGSVNTLQVPYTSHVMHTNPVEMDSGLGRGRLYLVMPDASTDQGCLMIIHGGVTVNFAQVFHPPLTALESLWCFDACQGTYIEATKDEGDGPPARYSHAGFALTADSFVIFGGKAPLRNGSTMDTALLHDVWLFSFQDQNNRSACEGTWQNLSAAHREMPSISAPAVLALTIAGRQRILVFGGQADDIWQTASDAFFEISIEGQTYSIQDVKQEQGRLPGRMGHTLKQYSNDSLLLFGGRGADEPTTASEAFLLRYYVDQNDVICISQAIPFFRHEPMIGMSVASLSSGLILMASTVVRIAAEEEVHSQAAGILYLPFGLCQAGHVRNMFAAECKACPKGTWGSSGKACVNCSSGTTTPGSGSTSTDDCTVCAQSICNWHGNCSVVGSQTMCSCHWGYYDWDNCFMPYYYIAGGALLLLFVSVLVVAGYISVKQHGAQQELHREQRASAKRMSTFMAVWKIEWGQLRLRHVIGQGGYGDVWLAELNDMLVVVKKLKQYLQCDDLCSREFQREVELMKLHRHPNIVFFLGAGTDPRNEPFLVMEYAKRGSLKALLQNSSVTISHTDRLRFMLDAAKGMEYLHGLHPPVVHRDLKCSNLLVTERWVVKVADFGTARLMSHLNESSRHRRPTDTGRTQPVNETDPLLLHQDDSPVTFNNGTDAYVSPERIRKELYHTSADVYSFGIVLCEAYMRETPYRKKNYKFSNELYKDVLEGGRPDFPKDEAPGDYTALVTACWQHDPADRLSFPEIVRSLDVQLIAW
eukprot:scpid19858/ scgid6199/ Probable serine/threonine-protein kinase drkD; Receptor-like kinase D